MQKPTYLDAFDTWLRLLDKGCRWAWYSRLGALGGIHVVGESPRARGSGTTKAGGSSLRMIDGSTGKGGRRSG